MAVCKRLAVRTLLNIADILLLNNVYLHGIGQLPVIQTLLQQNDCQVCNFRYACMQRIGIAKDTLRFRGKQNCHKKMATLVKILTQ